MQLNEPMPRPNMQLMDAKHQGQIGCASALSAGRLTAGDDSRFLKPLCCPPQ
jgi:hypothetical protein